MLVAVQVFAWYIVFRNLVCDHLCHIWISRILDTVWHSLRTHCLLLPTPPLFRSRQSGCPESVESLPLVQRSQAPFPCVFFDHASSCFFPLPRDLHFVTRSRRISETARLGPFLVDRI